MTTLFVTRHRGAREWAQEEGLRVERFVEHLEVTAVTPGDLVIGSLPVGLAAEVCRRGARYLHLDLTLPPDRRGAELTAAEMRALGARLTEYRVERLEANLGAGHDWGSRKGQ